MVYVLYLIFFQKLEKNYFLKKFSNSLKIFNHSNLIGKSS